MCRKDFMLLQRENSKKRKATADDLRKKEKECRKLHQELGAVSWHIAYRPLLSYLLPRCQSEASCETILIKVVPPSGSSSWKSNSFWYSWFCAKTRFETEADFNSEMAYSLCLLPWKLVILGLDQLNFDGVWSICYRHSFFLKKSLKILRRVVFIHNTVEPFVSDHLSSAASFPKYQIFSSQITSRERLLVELKAWSLIAASCHRDNLNANTYQ